MFNELTKNKWILCALLAIAIVTLMWFLMPDPGTHEDGVQVDQQASAAQQNGENSTPAASENTEPGYYFVKVTDGAVNVYWYEGDKKNLYRETDIEFSLLSAEDQKLLETGIRLENEQELAGFLENFDS